MKNNPIIVYNMYRNTCHSVPFFLFLHPNIDFKLSWPCEETPTDRLKPVDAGNVIVWNHPVTLLKRKLIRSSCEKIEEL